MKRGINFYEALFLALLVIKGLGLTFFGSFVSWYEVFFPVVLAGMLAILSAIAKIRSWDKKFEFWIWKLLMKREVKKAAKDARKTFNPGAAHDPQNL